jgi:hypothetical protein
MTQKARLSNYNHLKKEWIIERTDTDTHDGQPLVSVISKPLTHKQAIEMIVYLNRHRSEPRTDVEMVKIKKPAEIVCSGVMIDCGESS